MTYEESVKSLKARAAEAEAVEGTRRYSYTLTPQDVLEYTIGSQKKLLTVLMIAVLCFVAVMVLGSIVVNMYIVIIMATLTGVFALTILFFATSILKAKKNGGGNAVEVILSFNSVGIVMRTATKEITSLYVLSYNDFESIVEYGGQVVGLRQGVAYVIPKRIFTEEEFEIFRRFSFASAGRKCIYKGFKP